MRKPFPDNPPEPTAIFDCIIWYPAPKGSLSGLKKVNILNFWYGFKNDIINGRDISKVNVVSSDENKCTVLFDSKHSIEDKILNEQFNY